MRWLASYSVRRPTLISPKVVSVLSFPDRGNTAKIAFRDLWDNLQIVAIQSAPSPRPGRASRSQAARCYLPWLLARGRNGGCQIVEPGCPRRSAHELS